MLPAMASPRVPARVRRQGRRPGQNAQGMVEFALILPLILFIVCVCIDAGRLVYTYNVISSIARDGARTLTLGTQTYSDCLALKRMEAAGQAFPLYADPQSLYTDSPPSSGGWTHPAVGTGYVYIYPAVATADPPDSQILPDNCDSLKARQWPTGVAHDITVQIKYDFVPLTPLASSLFNSGITITAISVEQAEPCPGATC